VTQSSLLQVLDPLEMYATVELLQQTITEKTQKLMQMNQQMQQVNDNLEVQVQARTLELTVANQQLAASNQQLQQALDYLKATQEELIQSEKMAALGQLIADVTHEINNPLGAIRSSVNRIANFWRQDFKQLPQFFQKLDPEKSSYFWQLLHQSSQLKTSLSSKEKRQLKRKLIQQLEAGEIENAAAIAEILFDLEVFQDIEPFWGLFKDPESFHILQMADQIHTVQTSTDYISQSVERATKIVSALKNYAHYDHSEEKKLAHIPDGLETVLAIYQNQFDQGVTVVKYYEDSLPLVLCYADELNQVWTNLIYNALQAMENQGTLTIDVKQQEGSVQVSITDSGTGISPEVMPRLFERFFTTKPTGKGSGLGLDIVRRIVDKHQGTIKVNSQPGLTTFTVSFPLEIKPEEKFYA
jgi:two-component system, NtrC family, sensor kinase